MGLLLSRLDRYICICVLYVCMYNMELHVYVCCDKCVLCLLACTCSRLILHCIGCSGFTKLGSGSLQNMLNQPKRAHDRAEANHGRDGQSEEHSAKSSRP